MKILKKLLHAIFSIFLIWQTVQLVERILTNQPSGFLDKLLDSVFVNLFVTGIFTIVYAFPVYRLLPARYYSIQNPRLLKIIGQIMQINLFKKLLNRTIWNKKQNKKYFFSGNRKGFNDLEITTMKSEFGHFIGFCVVMILTIVIGLKANYSMAIMILIGNVLFNFYPFMLQRFHRLRLSELKNRLM
jgi:Glycosyl-4,4'-diaponeurosporenoate acyltransferase